MEMREMRGMNDFDFASKNALAGGDSTAQNMLLAIGELRAKAKGRLKEGFVKDRVVADLRVQSQEILEKYKKARAKEAENHERAMDQFKTVHEGIMQKEYGARNQPAYLRELEIKYGSMSNKDLTKAVNEIGNTGGLSLYFKDKRDLETAIYSLRQRGTQEAIDACDSASHSLISQNYETPWIHLENYKKLAYQKDHFGGIPDGSISAGGGTYRIDDLLTEGLDK